MSKSSQNPWKIVPRTQQKTMLKNRTHKTEKITKNDLKMAPKKWRNFGGNPYWGAFGGPNRFCDEKVGPQRCQSPPKARKMSQKWHKRTPECENELQKSTLFGAKRKCAAKADPFQSQARRTARSAYNNQGHFLICLSIMMPQKMKKWLVGLNTSQKLKSKK